MIQMRQLLSRFRWSRHLLAALVLVAVMAQAPAAPTNVVINAPAALNTIVYYVDPDFVGSKTGASTTPWAALTDTGAWTTINATLATNNVTVYFSAKEAGSAANESVGTEVHVARTDSSTHRLTLDGMSYYNTNDASPSWSVNPGSYKAALTGGGTGIALGWIGSEARQNYITLRGFDLSGNNARLSFGGSYVIVENNYSHDVTGSAPAIYMHYANTDGTGCASPRAFSNVTIRNNVVLRSLGESIYLGGSNGETNGCTDNTSSYILVENNTITDAGYSGEQGDGIDIKVGLTHVTVRGNTITGGVNNNAAITFGGAYDGANQNTVIEWNVIDNSPGNGILMGNGFGSELYGITVRYNTITDSAAGGIVMTGGDYPLLDIHYIAILQNTVKSNAGVGIGAGSVDNLTVMNNLVFSNNTSTPTYQITLNGAAAADGSNVIDYCLFAPGSDDSYANARFGIHNVVQSSVSGLTVDAAHPGYPPY